MEQKYIKYVALYLRKSRGDAETDLDKHRKVLTELCTENGWKYIEYEEIMSGDSIAMRPIFQRLLNDIENGVFDAVCVVDIDRLGRGDLGDQDKIKKSFAKSDTYVITPQQIYNLNNDDDEFVVDMKGFIARREYKQIVKRLTQGKKMGSRLGMWTNGTPPYPYEYQRYKDKYNEHGLVVNDEKLKTYRFIIDSVIQENKTPANIAYELNHQGILSPKNCSWSAFTINRMIQDETHLGKIISNKTQGDGHANKKPNSKELKSLPKDLWVIVNNCHEPVKTQEEHEQILLFLSRLTKMPHRTQNNILYFSGLIKCGICGHTMGLWLRENRNNEIYLKHCWYTDMLGNKCINQGAKVDTIKEYVDKQIATRKQILKNIYETSDINEDKISIDKKITNLKLDIENKNKVYSRLQDAFENGVYTLQEFKERKDKITNIVKELNGQIEILQIQLKQFNEDSIKSKIQKIELLEKIQLNENTDNQQLNTSYKSVIDSIIWTRNGDDISIDINYI